MKVLDRKEWEKTGNMPLKVQAKNQAVIKGMPKARSPRNESLESRWEVFDHCMACRLLGVAYIWLITSVTD